MDPIFYVDVASPNAYLAYRVLPGIEARTGRAFRPVPVLLGGLFKLTGNQSPMTAYAAIPAKLAYEQRVMRRFVERHRLGAFRMNPHFPVNTLLVMRAAVAAEAEGLLEPFLEATFRLIWEDGCNLGDGVVLAQSLAEAGLPAEKLLALAHNPAVKERLAEDTRLAAEKGVFGVPSFLVGDELYFGKDSLAEVEEAVANSVHNLP